jgi:hypothetical protein
MWLLRKERESNREDAKGFKVALLTHPKVVEGSASSHNKKDERLPMTGTIDEIGFAIQESINEVYNYSYDPRRGVNDDGIE